MIRSGVTSANAEVMWFSIDAFVLVTQQVTPRLWCRSRVCVLPACLLLYSRRLIGRGLVVASLRLYTFYDETILTMKYSKSTLYLTSGTDEGLPA